MDEPLWNSWLGGQNYRFSMAPGLVATTFYRFPDLPVELQLDIWEFAYAAAGIIPSVLFFNLQGVQTIEGRVICFTPDAHAASSTSNLRALLRTCHTARKTALKSLKVLTLLRFDTSSGTFTELRIPFDVEKTCFCINNWHGHGINPETVEKISGMDFAKNIKRVAFVVNNNDIRNFALWATYEEFGKELRQLAFRFHNASHIGRISRIASELRAFLKEEDVLPLLSLQEFDQKTMVDGVLVTKPYHQRKSLFRNAILMSYEGWGERIEDAIQKADSRLHGAVDSIIWAYRNTVQAREFEALAELGVSSNTIEILIDRVLRREFREDFDGRESVSVQNIPQLALSGGVWPRYYTEVSGYALTGY